VRGQADKDRVCGDQHHRARHRRVRQRGYPGGKVDSQRHARKAQQERLFARQSGPLSAHAGKHPGREQGSRQEHPPGPDYEGRSPRQTHERGASRKGQDAKEQDTPMEGGMLGFGTGPVHIRRWLLDRREGGARDVLRHNEQMGARRGFHSSRSSISSGASASSSLNVLLPLSSSASSSSSFPRSSCARAAYWSSLAWIRA